MQQTYPYTKISKFSIQTLNGKKYDFSKIANFRILLHKTAHFKKFACPPLPLKILIVIHSDSFESEIVEVSRAKNVRERKY